MCIRDRSVHEPSKTAPRAAKGAPRASQQRPIASQERPKSLPRAPQWAPRGLPRRPREVSGTIWRSPSSKKVPFADDLSRDSLKKRCLGCFSLIFHLRAEAVNLISTRPYRVEMRFGSSASESSHWNEEVAQRHQTGPLSGAKIDPRATNLDQISPQRGQLGPQGVQLGPNFAQERSTWTQRRPIGTRAANFGPRTIFKF